MENKTQELNQQNEESAELIEETIEQQNSVDEEKEEQPNTSLQIKTHVFKPKTTEEDDGHRWFMKKQTVKDKIRELNCQIADNFFPRLNEFIEDTLVKAVYRTKCNKRKTVRAMDV